MAKLDKSKYTKSEWKKIRDDRRRAKAVKRLQEAATPQPPKQTVAPPPPAPKLTKRKNIPPTSETGFVLGNGTSRKNLKPEEIHQYGKLYGCNALYREYRPDYLVAVDVKMILEINKAGFQHENQVWTNPNKSYQNMKNLNFFQPSKGWSSGPTALWLAAQHGYDKIFILGFDYRGLEDGKKLNNLYADTRNYKKSTDGATFFGNWLRQTVSVVKEHPETTFFRVITPDNYIPEELNKFNNLKHIYVEDFKKMFNLS